MSPDVYHDKWIKTAEEWIKEKEKISEGKFYILRLNNDKRAVLNTIVWIIRNSMVKRLLIRLAWFYKYPYSLEAIVRRVEVLNDEVFYVSPYDVVEVIDHVKLGKVLRKDEAKIDNPDNIFRLLDEISKSFSDEAKNDLERITKNLKNYENYIEY